MEGSRESIPSTRRVVHSELTCFRSFLFFSFPRMAATVFQTFVASDDASTTLLQLKRLHGLMPYFVLKGILRVSNPMAMIRGKLRRVASFPFLPLLPFSSSNLTCFSRFLGILELFLARPFGGQSLVQRFVVPSLPSSNSTTRAQTDGT